MADQTVKYAIEIVDKWSKDLKRLESTLEKLEHKQKRAFTAAPSGKRDEFVDFINKRNAAYENLNKSAYDSTRKLGSGTDFLRGKTSQLAGAVKGVAAAYIGIQGIKALGNLAKDSYLAAAQMEKYEVTLKTMLGSQRAASERMMEYSDLALITPYQLDDIVAAGNKLQSIGRYSRENMLQLGDLAAATGKPIDQVLEAFATLATGQKGQATKMFRNLLISTEDWAKATGKGVSKTGELQATHEEMIKALPEILKAKGFLGMMGEQAKSTSGQIENLKGAVFRFKIALGDRLKPEMTSMIKKTTEVVRSLKSWVEVPVSEKMRQEQVEANLLAKRLGDLNLSESERVEIFNELKRLQPDIVDGISAENIEMDKLLDNVRKYNVEMSKRIFLQKKQEEIDKWKEKASKEMDKSLEQFANVQERMMNIIEVAKKSDPKMAGYVEEAFFGRYWDRDARNKMYQEVRGAGRDDILYMFNQSGFDTSTTDHDKFYAEAKLIAELARKTGQHKALDKLWGDGKFGYLGSEFTQAVIQWDAAKSYQRHYFNLEADLAEFQRKMSINLDDGGSDSGDGGGGSDSGDGGGGDELDFDKAQDTITGGGKSMKVINITLDSLIANNTNVFEPGQDPNSAQDFLDKLSRALTMVVNDVNYM